MLSKSENYKLSLNLPTTLMPIHCNLPAVEHSLLLRWKEMNLYEALRTPSEEKQKPYFFLHDGPPYANGPLHVGHAFNKCLKDFILKSKRLSGYQVSFIPGWDCHGLPIELKAEEIVQATKQNGITAPNFRVICQKYAESQVDLQKESFMRFGILGDWENPYKTMDFKTQANSVRALAQLYKNKHLKQGTLPIYWCLECQSAISDSEVEYEHKEEQSLYVRFLAIDQSDLDVIFKHACSKRVSAVIWTTTPWTLPANEAIAVHPELIYQLVYVPSENDYLLLAKNRVTQILSLKDLQEFEVIGECFGKELINLKFCHPFLAKSVPMIASDHVLDTSGTGLVHIAPAHGPEDFELGIKYGLPVKNGIDFNGNFPSDHPIFPGESLKDVLGNILEILNETQSLYAVAPCQHQVACCWRHRTQLIYLTTPQWFISMDQNGLRESAIESLSKVHWQTPWGKERIRNLISMRPDWCISRQRQWGNPLPLFIHKETKELHPRTEELILLVADKIETHGVEAWWDFPAKNFLGEDFNKYEKETSVLDVWLDSGLTHVSIQREPEMQFPASLYFEGNDQYRGWFMSSLITGVALNGVSPYKEVLSHGFIVDEHGQKMSKSLGNVIEPIKICNEKGADILRLWAASADYRKEAAISEEILTHAQEAYRRIRNTLRFLLSNLNDFSLERDGVSEQDLVAIDQWILDKALQLDLAIKTSYDEYNFQAICKMLMKFCSIDLGSIYFSIIKDRLYVSRKNSLARRSALTACYHLLQTCLRWISPILSFTAEEIWDYLPEPKEASVFLTQWWVLPKISNELMKISQKQWDELFHLRARVFSELDKYRQKCNIRSTLDLSVKLKCSKNFYEFWQDAEDELSFFFSVSKVKLSIADENTGVEIKEKEFDWTIALKELVIEVEQVSERRCSRCWLKIVPVEFTEAICSNCESILNPNESVKERKFF